MLRKLFLFFVILFVQLFDILSCSVHLFSLFFLPDSQRVGGGQTSAEAYDLGFIKKSFFVDKVLIFLPESDYGTVPRHNYATLYI